MSKACLHDCFDRPMFLGDFVQGTYDDIIFKGVLSLDLISLKPVIRTYPEDVNILVECVNDFSALTGIERLKSDFPKDAVYAFKDKILSELSFYIKEVYDV